MRMLSYGVRFAAVDDQQLVLVELHFLRDVRVEDRDAGAAVVDQQVLEVPEDALQDRHVDVFAVQVGVAVGLVGVWLVSRTTSTTSPSGSISSMNVSIIRGLVMAAISTGTVERVSSSR